MRKLFNLVARWIILLVMGLSIICFLIIPIVAIRWSANPFPGVMVEQTLLVSSIGGETWGPEVLQIGGQEQVIQVNGKPVKTLREFNTELAGFQVGDVIKVTTLNQVDIKSTYPNIPIIHFPRKDFLRLFWLPYFIGLAYLIMGILVYRFTRRSLSGRAFAYFCANASIVSVLTFDLATTQIGTIVWTFAIAQIGGSVIGMAWLIPEELPSMKGRIWVRVVAYSVSIILALWGFRSIQLLNQPWAYIQPWKWSYIYAAFGLVIFAGLMIYRLRKPISALVSQQVRIILWGGIIAFTPVALWFAGQLFFYSPWNPLIFMPFLLFFPASITIAILRYRLLDVDLIVRRTVIYSALTIFLVTIYISLILIFGELSSRLLGKSNIYTVLSTLVIVAIFNPLRKWIQKVVDRRFYRERYDVEKKIHEFQQRLRHEVDLDDISHDLLEVVQQTMQPEFMSLWIKRSKKPKSTGLD